MNAVVANREDFFTPNCCPIALRTIQGDKAVQHAGDLTDIRHTHDFAELIIITHGGGEHWINGTVYNVSEGDVFLIQGKSEHYFTKRRSLSMYNIMFDESYVREHLKSLYTLSGFNAFFLFEPTCRRTHHFQSHLHLAPESMYLLSPMLQRMYDEHKKTEAGFDLMLLSALLEILVLISREYAHCSNPKAKSLCRLGDLIAKMEKEYMQKWTLQRISRIAAMAPSTLLPLFKDVTGHSPIDYLLHVRLAHAAEMLLKTKNSIYSIAEANGFESSSYFARQFRNVFNCSPRDYRTHISPASDPFIPKTVK